MTWALYGTLLFLVTTNVLLNNKEYYPSPSAYSNGSFAVVTITSSGDTVGCQTFMQNGQPASSLIKVGSGIQSSGVIVLTSGDYLVFWYENGYLYGQIYNFNGSSINNNFEIASVPYYSNMNFINFENSENFLATWLYGGNLYGRIYSNYQPGQIFEVPSYETDGSVKVYDVIGKPDQSFIYVWYSQGTTGSKIYFQAYFANGQTQGTYVQVNTETLGTCSSVSIAILLNNAFIITWESDAQVWAQIYGPNFNTIGNNFEVGNEESCKTKTPNVEAWISGLYLIFYNCVEFNTNYEIVYGQFFSPDHSPLGSSFIILDEQTNFEGFSPYGNGSFLVTYTKNHEAYASFFEAYNCTQPNAECPAGTLCNTETNACSECLNNQECKSGKPYCDNSECVECKNNGECGNGNPFCVQQACHQCISNQNCTQGSQTFCVNNTCSGCVTNAECNGFSSTPFCDQFNGECVQCFRNNSECNQEDEPYCLNTECVSCLINTECPSAKPVCSSGICYQCIANNNCTKGKTLFCHNNTCTGCLNNQDCSSNASFPYCDQVNGECVQCLQNNDECTSGNDKYCENTECVACLNNEECGGKVPYCIHGICYQCASDSNCTQYPNLFCHNHTCTGCLNDEDCSSYVETPFCDPTNGECVECFQNNEECNSNVEKYCKNTVCVECLNNNECLTGICSADMCSGCQENSECPNNYICDHQTKSCVQCLSNRECATLSQVCNTITNLCVNCTTNAECGILVCQNNTCVNCGDEVKCGSGRTCSNGMCIECYDNYECPGTAPYCQNNSCVECLSNKECSDQVCSYGQCSKCQTNHECTEDNLSFCNQETGSCSLCLSNDECPGGLECCINETPVVCSQQCTQSSGLSPIVYISAASAILIIAAVCYLKFRPKNRSYILADQEVSLMQNPPNDTDVEPSVNYLGQIETLRAPSIYSESTTMRNAKEELQKALNVK